MFSKYTNNIRLPIPRGRPHVLKNVDCDNRCPRCPCLTSGAVADTTISGSYSAAGYGEWTYTVTGDTSSVYNVYVFMDPSVESIDWLTGFSNDAGWTNPSALYTANASTDPWNDSTWDGLKYVIWSRWVEDHWADAASSGDTFSFEDAHYYLGGGQYVDLINHPGPLLLNDPGNADALSAGWADSMGNWTEYTLANGDTVANAITPEPATMALFGLGLLGMAARLHRRKT